MPDDNPDYLMGYARGGLEKILQAKKEFEQLWTPIPFGKLEETRGTAPYRAFFEACRKHGGKGVKVTARKDKDGGIEFLVEARRPFNETAKKFLPILPPPSGGRRLRLELKLKSKAALKNKKT